MKQHAFDWMETAQTPRRATLIQVGMCKTIEHAMKASMRMHAGRAFSQAWHAARLGLSRSYFSEIVKGAKPVPEWLIKPFCMLTCTLLLEQFLKEQEQQKLDAARDTVAAQINRIVRAA